MWQPLAVTAGKAPILLRGEQVIRIQGGVALYRPPHTQPLQDYLRGTVYITTKRLCYVNSNNALLSACCSLQSIEEHRFIGKFLRQSSKIALKLRKLPRYAPWVCEICSFANQPEADECVNCGVQPAERKLVDIAAESPVCPICTFENHTALSSCEMCGASLGEGAVEELGEETILSFRDGGGSAFLASFEEALRQITSTGEPAPTSEPELAIAQKYLTPGIIRLQLDREAELQENAEVLDSAFADLETLRRRASQVIAFAQSNGLGRNSLGLFTPTTKDMVGDELAFHQQLAREIVSFLDDVLERVGGIMALHDVYAQYNRARGIELISPGDLARALTLCDNLDLPVTVRVLKSGLRVVEYRRNRTLAKLVDWIVNLEEWQRVAGVSAQDASAHFGWSVTVSADELARAEESGELCRDEHVSGIRFFPNLILNPEQCT